SSYSRRYQAAPSFPTRRSSDLARLPKRSEYSVRLQLETVFLDNKTCRITVRDAGFGDFFPATDFHAEKTIHLGGNDGKFNSLSRSEEHTSELQSRFDLVCRLLL